MASSHNFAKFLSDEFATRGWDQRTAALQIGVRESAVHNWLHKGFIPKTKSIVMIALALGIDVDIVMKEAGVDGPAKRTGRTDDDDRLDREAAILLRNDRYRDVLRKIARLPIDKQKTYLDIIDRILGDEA